MDVLNYSFNLVLEREYFRNAQIWWFPKEFSQCVLGSKSSGSNACTLIALLVANMCNQRKIKILPLANGDLCQEIIDALGESIIKGNEIHQRLMEMNAFEHSSLTVPEAIMAGGPIIKSITEWKSLVFFLDLGESLCDKLIESVTEWYSGDLSIGRSDLYVVLIAENRSVLWVFQKDVEKVTLLDSHQHHYRGAVIAQTSIYHLHDLCLWYYSLMESTCGKPECYELSFLYFQ